MPMNLRTRLAQATPVVPNPRVLVSGQPVATMADTYGVDLEAGEFAVYSFGYAEPCGIDAIVKTAVEFLADLLDDIERIAGPKGPFLQYLGVL